jgi:hypothetical protein
MAAVLTRVRALRSAMLVVVAAAALGCEGMARVRPVRPTTAEALLADLAARRDAVASMRARVRLRSGLARVWTRQALLVQRPAAIRVDVLSPFGLALAFGTEGRTLWAFPPQRGVRYEGAATPANFQRLVGAPLAVPDMVDVLLGVPPARRAVGPPALERDGDRWLVTVRYEGGTQVIGFSGDTLEVASVDEHPDGGAAVRVGYADYAEGFARTLDLVTEGGESVRIAFDEVEANATIDPGVFEGPPAPRVLPIERAAPS